MDSLHVLAGVTLQLAAAAVLRTNVVNGRPWLLVLAFELANEANDLLVEQWPDSRMQWGEGGKDVILTMLLPTLIMMVARHRSSLLTGSHR